MSFSIVFLFPPPFYRFYSQFLFFKTTSTSSSHLWCVNYLCIIDLFIGSYHQIKMIRSLQSSRITSRFASYSRRQFSSKKYAKTTAGSGSSGESDTSSSMIPRGPVSWTALGLVTVAAASAVSYYQIERERRLEQAMGKIVSRACQRNWLPHLFVHILCFK